MQGMPAPYGVYNYMPPMPASFNPYATLPAGGIPYPNTFNFPQAPGRFSKYNATENSKFVFLGGYNYGTYPGSYNHQIQQGGYPHPQQQHQDPNKPYGF